MVFITYFPINYLLEEGATSWCFYIIGYIIDKLPMCWLTVLILTYLSKTGSPSLDQFYSRNQTAM